MLTALLDALIGFVGVLVGWLVDVAVVLEATPFSFAWPLLLALLLQLLAGGGERRRVVGAGGRVAHQLWLPRDNYRPRTLP